jgi:D-alanyl-lipoteichoic acid acyltransferase DltB (MBOAT superfamily)
VANVGVLAIFKYFNFVNENASILLQYVGIKNPIPFLNILLPIGLSFHTFQAMSYTIEVYHGIQKPEKHFGIYALYVMFYPQLVAGPIERPQNLIHQFREKHFFEYNRFIEGLRLMTWGFFKKIVIADRMALIVNSVYDSPGEYQGFTLLIATLAFAFQIYCDFSGYSDIAIGAARVMGFTLMRNFDTPYFSSSVSEFWKRWHISLSTWFKDYVYIPLGGSRVKIYRYQLNILIVFAISGIWHGANWTFLMWGLLNGGYILIERLWINSTKISTGIINRITGIFITFSLITFSWIFFRANTLHDALYIIGHIPTDAVKWLQPAYILQGLQSAGIKSQDIFTIGFSFAILFSVEIFRNINKTDFNQWIASQSVGLRWSYYYIILFSIILFGVFDKQQFIYFQF